MPDQVAAGVRRIERFAASLGPSTGTNPAPRDRFGALAVSPGGTSASSRASPDATLHDASRTHPIRKLEGVPRDEGGQYQVRLGRFRFRYDIEGHALVLDYCGLRREDTYR